MTEEELSKKDKTEQRRARAAARLNAEKARSRRRAMMFRTGIVLAVIAVLAAVAALMINNRPQEVASSGPVPSAANIYGGVNAAAPESGADASVDAEKIPGAVDGKPAGITAPAETDPASVVLYVDPNCVHCAEFETMYGDSLKQKAEEGAISLETRTIAILDRNSPTNYSSRAANAMACVADAKPEKYLEFTGAVFANYPNGELANQGLVDLAEEHGVTGINDCVKDGKFRPFVKFTTEAATEHGITGTPTIFINGEMWDLQGDFDTVLNEAIAG